MRTTLTIDDEVLAEAKAEARQREVSVGEVISAWAKRGRYAKPQAQSNQVFPTFPARPGHPKITLEQIKAADDEY